MEKETLIWTSLNCLEFGEKLKGNPPVSTFYLNFKEIYCMKVFPVALRNLLLVK